MPQCKNCSHAPANDFGALVCGGCGAPLANPEDLHARVAIVAPNGSGKTFMANILVNDHGYQRLSLAYEVRAECARRWPGIDWWTQDKDSPRAELGGKSVREVLIDVGTHEVRAADPDFWIKRLGETIERTTGPIVVDDVRFVNEMRDLKANGFRLVCIIRPGFWDPRKADAALLELYDHALVEADVVVVNNGDDASIDRFIEVLR